MIPPVDHNTATPPNQTKKTPLLPHAKPNLIQRMVSVVKKSEYIEEKESLVKTKQYGTCSYY